MRKNAENEIYTHFNKYTYKLLLIIKLLSSAKKCGK